MSEAKDRIIRFIESLPESCSREEIIIAIIIHDLQEINRREGREWPFPSPTEKNSNDKH